MSTTNPLATMAQTERALTQAINAASDTLDQVGTKHLDEAKARLHASASACKDRIAAAKADLYATIADVLCDLGGFTGEITQALKANIVALPAIAYSDEEIIDLDASPVAETIPADDGEVIDLNADGVIVPVVQMAANSPTKRAAKKRR